MRKYYLDTPPKTFFIRPVSQLPAAKMSSTRQRKKETYPKRGEESTLHNGTTTTSKLDSSAQTFDLASFLVHFSLLIFYTLVHVWGVIALKEAAKDQKIGYKFSSLRSLMYATIQNLYIQTGYCVLAVVCDVVPASTLKNNLESARNFIFTTLAFPLAMIVTVGYWGILAMSTGYLYDKMGLAVMAYVPPLLNHCWHTVVGVAVVLEVMFVVHHSPSHHTAITTSFLLTFAYAAEVFVVYYMADVVPYPFMRQLGPGGMAAFFLATLPVYLGFCYLGRALSYLRWGDKRLQTA